jgi:DNA repair exonuclease SbcCD ATPase subunit
MVYLICDKCKHHYELQEGEFPGNVGDACDCGGKLRSAEDLPDTDDKDETSVEELEKELNLKENEIKGLREKLTRTQEQLQDTMNEKKSLEKRMSELELKEIDLKLNNSENLRQEHNKLEHRVQVTKKQLDDANDELKFQNKVIEDMENRGIVDIILGRLPESFERYRKRK